MKSLSCDLWGFTLFRLAARAVQGAAHFETHTEGKDEANVLSRREWGKPAVTYEVRTEQN